MGLIGKVIASFVEKLPGSNTSANFSTVEELSGDNRTVQTFGPCNEDFKPPKNCKTYDVRLGKDKGYIISIAYHTQPVQSVVAEHGERRLYSTNINGNEIQAEIFIKNDATVLITNKGNPGYWLLMADGTIKMNDATVTIGGDVITKKGISLDNHTHGQPSDSDGDGEAETYKATL